MSRTWQTILIVLTIVVFIAGANLYPIAWHGFYYQCYAIAILILSILVFDSMKTIASKILFWLAVFNVLDEVFFEPTGFYLAEYVTCAAVTIFIIIKDLKKWRMNRKKLR